MSRRRVVASTAAGLALAAIATVATEADAAQNLVGGVLLGLTAGVGSSVLRRERHETTSEP